MRYPPELIYELGNALIDEVAANPKCKTATYEMRKAMTEFALKAELEGYHVVPPSHWMKDAEKFTLWIIAGLMVLGMLSWI